MKIVTTVEPRMNSTTLLGKVFLSVCGGLILAYLTRHNRNNPDLVSYIDFLAPSTLHWSELVLTLDEHSDYLLPKRIIEYFEPDYPLFSYSRIVKLYKEKNDWVEIKEQVVRTVHV